MNKRIVSSALVCLIVSGVSALCFGRVSLYPQDSTSEEKSLSDEQLEINKTVLLEGTDESIRARAATLILSDANPLAREILIETLKQDKNGLARMAICRALSSTRADKTEVLNKEEFIQPLLNLLISLDDALQVRLAADAMLIYRYDEFSGQVEEILADSGVSQKAKLNIITLLAMLPDMKATIQLIRLIDDSDKLVTVKAQEAVQSIGIPVGKDPKTRAEIVRELQRKGKDKFIQDWLIRQDLNLSQMEAKMKLWRDRYIASLDKLYAAVTDEAEKGKFLATYLADSEPAVKLWAIDKVYKWRLGTDPKASMLALISPALVNLISDSDRDVRIKTASLLSLMSQIDSAGALSEQFKIEQDPEVKTELFVALGWSAYYGSLPGAAVKVAPELRKQTLKWSEEYLTANDPSKVRKGSDVVRKLFEHDGFSDAEVSKFLNLISAKYQELKDSSPEPFSSEMLGIMASICGSSVYKAKAAAVYKPLFDSALKGQIDSVRQAAVEGIINIDKSSALQLLRVDFPNDRNPAVRKKLMALADELGSKDDLTWLAEKISSAPDEGLLAWMTMLKIFKRGDLATIADWQTRIEQKYNEEKLSDSQMISFFEIAETKAAEQKDSKILNDVQVRLAGLYRKTADFEKAAKYFGLAMKNASDPQGKEAFLASLLEVYLRWPKLDLAVQLINNRLLEQDLGIDNPVAGVLNDYLASPPAGTDSNTLIGPLRKINIPAERPLWSAMTQKWSEQFSPPPDPNTSVKK